MPTVAILAMCVETKSEKHTQSSVLLTWQNEKGWSEYDFPENFMTILGRLGM